MNHIGLTYYKIRKGDVFQIYNKIDRYVIIDYDYNFVYAINLENPKIHFNRVIIKKFSYNELINAKLTPVR